MFCDLVLTLLLTGIVSIWQCYLRPDWCLITRTIWKGLRGVRSTIRHGERRSFVCNGIRLCCKVIILRYVTLKVKKKSRGRLLIVWKPSKNMAPFKRKDFSVTDAVLLTRNDAHLLQYLGIFLRLVIWYNNVTVVSVLCLGFRKLCNLQEWSIGLKTCLFTFRKFVRVSYEN